MSEQPGKIEVTIVKATDVLAADRGGTSDPYLEVYAGGKDSKKTSVIKKTLNPEWNETFTLDVAPGFGALDMKLFDWDQFGADDFLGQVLVPLDSLTENSPKEYTTAFESRRGLEDEVKGQLHFKVNLVRRPDDPYMKAPDEDPEARAKSTSEGIGALQVWVVAGSELAVMDSGGTSDPFVELSLGKSRAKTDVVKKTTQPVFAKCFIMDVAPGIAVLELNVYDHDVLGNNDFMGTTMVSVLELEEGDFHDEWHVLSGSDGGIKKYGRIRVQLKLLHAPRDVEIPRPFDDPEQRDIKTQRGIGALQIFLIAAKHVRGVDRGGTSDPYVRLTCGGNQRRSKVIKRTICPVWNESFVIDVPCGAAELELSLFDADVGGEDTLLGCCAIECHELDGEVGLLTEGWYELRNAPGLECIPPTAVRLRIECLVPATAPSVKMPDEDEDEILAKNESGTGTVEAHVIAVRGLSKMSHHGPGATFNLTVGLRLGFEQVQTTVHKDATSAIFNQGFRLDYTDEIEDPAVDIVLYDDRGTMSNTLGSGVLSLLDMDRGVWIDIWMSLSDIDDNGETYDTNVEVRLRVCLLREASEQGQMGLPEGCGEVWVTAMAAQDLPVAPNTQYGAPFVHVVVGQEEKESPEASKGTGRNPIWPDEPMAVMVVPDEYWLRVFVHVPDPTMGRSHCVGGVRLWLPDLVEGLDGETEEWYRLETTTQMLSKVPGPTSLYDEHTGFVAPPAGEAMIRLRICYAVKAHEPELDRLQRPGGLSLSRQLYPAATDSAVTGKAIGECIVTVVAGRSIPLHLAHNGEKLRCSVTLGHRTDYTFIRKAALPRWDDTFTMDLPHPSSVLFVTMVTKSGLTIGQCHAPLQSIDDGDEIEEWFTLTSPPEDEEALRRDIKRTVAKLESTSSAQPVEILLRIKVSRSQAFRKVPDELQEITCPWGCNLVFMVKEASKHFLECPSAPNGTEVVCCLNVDLGCTYVQQQRYFSRHVKRCVWSARRSVLLKQQETLRHLEESIASSESQVVSLQDQAKQLSLQLADAQSRLSDAQAKREAEEALIEAKSNEAAEGRARDSKVHIQATIDIEQEKADKPKAFGMVKPQVTGWELKECAGVMEGHTDSIQALTCIHEQGILVSGAGDGIIKTWDTKVEDTPVELATLTGHTSGVMSLCSWQDAVFSGGHDKSVMLWDMTTGKPIQTLEGHMSGVHGLIYLNGTLISTSHDKTLKLWDVRSGRCFTTVEGHQRGVYGMAVQETVLYSAAGKVLKTWDLRQIGATTLLQGSAMPPVKPRVGNGGEATMGNATGVYGHYLGNQFLYSNSTDPSIRRWDLERLRCIGFHDGHKDYVRALSGAAERLFSASDDGNVLVWRTTGPVHTIMATLEGHKGFVTSLQPMRGRLYSGSSDRTIRVWRS